MNFLVGLLLLLLLFHERRELAHTSLERVHEGFVVRVPGEEARQSDGAVIESFEVGADESEQVQHRIHLMGLHLVLALLQDAGVLP